MKRTSATLPVLVLALLLSLPTARAADANPPNKMSYQGYVVDTNGEPLGKDNPLNYDVIFRIYDGATAGALLWTEQQTVTIDKGYFSVSLGEGSQVGSDLRPALSAVFAGQTASDRFIGITVKKLSAADVEIMPRLRLLPAPYSFLATKANAVANATGVNLINTSGGNVGIGTTVPNYQLSLGNNAGNTKLALSDGGPTDSYGLGMGNSQFRLHVGNSSARFSFLDGPAGTEVMTIQGGGKVGIGTSAPIFTLNTTDQGTIATGTLRLQNSYIGHNGNSGDFGIQLKGIDNGINGHDLRIQGRTSPNGAFADLVTVKNHGNVGIGTTTPNYQLSLGSSVVNTKLALFDSDGTDTYGLGIGADQFRLHLGKPGARFSFLNGPAGTEVMTIQGGGNVGIGTSSPGSSLQVNGGIRARGGAPGGGGAANNGYAFSENGGDNDSGMFSTANGLIQFFTDSQEKMRITPEGNVGIGTTDPGATLGVRGTVKMLGTRGNLHNPWIPTGDGQSQTGIAASDGFLTVVISFIGKNCSFVVARVRGFVDGAFCGAASITGVVNQDWPTWENSFMMPVPKGSTWQVTFYRSSHNDCHPDIYITWIPLGR